MNKDSFNGKKSSFREGFPGGGLSISVKEVVYVSVEAVLGDYLREKS